MGGSGGSSPSQSHCGAVDGSAPPHVMHVQLARELLVGCDGLGPGVIVGGVHELGWAIGRESLMEWATAWLKSVE